MDLKFRIQFYVKWHQAFPAGYGHHRFGSGKRQMWVSIWPHGLQFVLIGSNLSLFFPTTYPAFLQTTDLIDLLRLEA